MKIIFEHEDDLKQIFEKYTSNLMIGGGYKFINKETKKETIIEDLNLLDFKIIVLEKDLLYAYLKVQLKI